MLAHVPDMRAEDAHAIVRRAAPGNSRKRTFLESDEVVDQFLHLMQREPEEEGRGSYLASLTRVAGTPIADTEYENELCAQVASSTGRRVNRRA